MGLVTEIFNVGHGEAIRLRFPDGRIVVRDFGRSTSAKPTPHSISPSQITIVPPNSQCDAVLSHAHEDHFNGFEVMAATGQRFFGTSYIPWLTMSDLGGLGWGMVTLSVYLHVYAPAAQRRRGGEWLRAAPVMASLSERICGIAAGHHFDWAIPSQCIWPPVSHEKVLSRTHFAVRRLEEQIEETTARNSLSEIQAARDRILKILSQYHGLDIETSRETPSVETCHEHLAEIDSALEQLDVLRDDASAIRDDLSVGDLIHYESVDDHSIVLHVDQKALFLSDLRPAAMNAMARNHMAHCEQSFSLVKSAHHGTRLGGKTFRNRVQHAGVVLHCCGEAHPSYHGPKADYCYLEPDCTICTDDHPKAQPLPAGFCGCTFQKESCCFEIS